LSSPGFAWRFAAATVLAAALVAAGCGGGGTEATKVSMSISEQGKNSIFTTPKSVKGGLVELTVKNKGKAPHGVQLVRYTGNHTADDALKQLGSASDKTPDWLRAEGGTPAVAGGQSTKASLNLASGNYLIIDSAQLGPSSGPPANAQLKVTSGDNGDLPDTPGTVVAARTGKDKYAWEISGLKAGKNDITFDSEGKDALHFIIAAPVKGKAPSQSKLKSDFAKAGSGPPPPYLDFTNARSTAILDGELSQTTELDLKKPGQYILFCPLTDRDGGKSHDQEGLLKVVTVK
jgi:hypothetical protein